MVFIDLIIDFPGECAVNICCEKYLNSFLSAIGGIRLENIKIGSYFNISSKLSIKDEKSDISIGRGGHYVSAQNLGNDDGLPL